MIEWHPGFFILYFLVWITLSFRGILNEIIFL